MNENRMSHLFLKEIFGALGSKREGHPTMLMGGREGSSEVQGWMGILFSEASGMGQGERRLGEAKACRRTSL